MENENLYLKSLIQKIRSAFLENNKSDYETKWQLINDLSVCFFDERYNKSVSLNSYNVLSVLLDSLSPLMFRDKSQEQLFDKFFLESMHHDAFIVLVRKYTDSSPSYQQDKILDMLEKFLHRGNLAAMFLYQCTDHESFMLSQISTSGFWSELITLVVSLPERVANKTKGQTKKIFSVSHYIPLVISSVWQRLQSVHHNIQNSHDCNIEFLRRLIGRLCTAGYSRTVGVKFASLLTKACAVDFIWRRISQSLISKFPSLSIELFLTHLLLNIQWFGYVEWILGDLLLSNKKIQYLLCVKLLSFHQFKEDIIIQNIIGYAATFSNKKDMFYKILNSLLNTWADESALKHQNFSQQYYLASCLMVCAGHLKKIETMSENTVFIQKALHGVQIRIGSPESAVRNLGMLVGENVICVLDPETPKLEFEYEKTNEIKHLQELIIIPPEPKNFVEDLHLPDEEQPITFSDKNSEIDAVTDDSDRNNTKNLKIESKIHEDLDSDDDDLEPYDMSNDVKQETTKSPLYIRDCLIGLIEQEKPEWAEKCLYAAESLIRGNPDELPQVAKEMAKVLLHLEDKFAMDDFIGCRQRALIALTAKCPAKVAEYLTTEFYGRDYNIRQRLDILEVLAAASQELSQIKTIKEEERSEKIVAPSDFVKNTQQHWREVIEKRLEAKTRRFSKTPRKTLPEPEINVFGPVAGYFFFPLLENYDKENKMLNLMGDDAYVLGRLLYTLGIIVQSASNTPVSRHMGLSFLKFLTAVRNHCEVFVRQAVIFAYASIFTSLPSYLLFSELQADIFCAQSWLKEIVDKDNDVQCQIHASKVLLLLMKLLEEEVPSITEVLRDS